MKPSASPLPLLFCSLVLSACAPGEHFGRTVPRPLAPGTPRDAYAMRELAAAPPAAARAWEEAGRRALRSGLSVAPTFRERIRFPNEEPHAVAYRFSLGRGQPLRLAVRAVAGDAPLFVDVFEIITENMFHHVHSARAGMDIEFVARSNAQYVVRLQPRLGAGGTYDVAVAGAFASTLVFPVADAGLHAIGGRFGDPRDGGIRPHEGIDIFAPRGTPVLAAVDGVVGSTRPTPIGGNVVWLYERGTGTEYYYAHLDRTMVREGQRVRAGEVLGTVGNTGNARTTPPHLHFGIYLPGRVAVDPTPRLRYMPALVNTTLDIPIDPGPLGQWTRVIGTRVPLRSAPADVGTVLAELGRSTPLLVLGGLGHWNRVVLNDGTSGFVDARELETTPASGALAGGGR